MIKLQYAILGSIIPMLVVFYYSNNIIDDLYNQNLNERFDLQLENYLPQKANMQQSSMTPLPNTPMPMRMPGSFKPPVDKIMMSGLTQMEEVYLSPEEKIIRKRSRGIG
jgi:hypothetical protein